MFVARFSTSAASMSLPKFDVQGSLFESLGSIAPDLFDDKDKYKLFARKVWPLLAALREELAQCYKLDTGRPGIEPVVLLGGGSERGRVDTKHRKALYLA
jgi:hypothetical protein